VSLLTLNSTRLALVERNLERLVEDGAITGGVLGVADAAGNTWFATCGVVSIDGTARPAELGHRFLLTSVTKPFTATQVLMLAEDGLLDLDAPVTSYIPEFGAHGKSAVTTRHLLTHTGGLSDTANLVEGPEATRAPDDYIAAALGTGLAFEPGEGWAYSSPGFWVMAELVNRLRGERYTDDVTGRISVPLELESTRYETGAESPAGFVGAVTQGGWDAHLPEQVRQAAYPAGGPVPTCCASARHFSTPCPRYRACFRLRSWSSYATATQPAGTWVARSSGASAGNDPDRATSRVLARSSITAPPASDSG